MTRGDPFRTFRAGYEIETPVTADFGIIRL
jgi:hypothetical protein